MKHSFGSDNHSGVHPRILEAIARENSGFRVAYGDEDYTQKVLSSLENMLGGNCKAIFVFNGTGANIVSIAPFVKHYESVICPSSAHIIVDECGGPARYTGCEFFTVDCPDGKITAEQLRAQMPYEGSSDKDWHHAPKRILSISQPTELGTIYTPDEIKELASIMHSHSGFLHMDGSRISNAAASLGMDIKEFTNYCGVDVLSFGGTKNGLLVGEAVVVFYGPNQNPRNREIAMNELEYYRKQTTQLYSKNRFIAAQFEEYLKDNLYLEMASHSNAMAQYLSKRLEEIPQIRISKKTESNAVFAILPKELCDKLLEKFYFYIWDESTYEVRWMCSFATRKEDIDEFITAIKLNLQ